MPVVTQSSIESAIFDKVQDRITAGQLTPYEQPTTISDLSVLRNITVMNEIRTVPEPGDDHDVHELEIFFTNPTGAPGDVRIDDVRIIRNRTTIFNAGNRVFILEPGVQKRIGASNIVVDLNTDTTVITLDMSYNVSVRTQDYRQLQG